MHKANVFTSANHTFNPRELLFSAARGSQVAALRSRRILLDMMKHDAEPRGPQQPGRIALIYEADAAPALKVFTAPLYIILRGSVTSGLSSHAIM